MDNLDRLTNMIAKGELKEALRILMDYSLKANLHAYKQVLTLSCQYHYWEHQRTLGLAPSMTEFKQIADATTSLLPMLQEKSSSKPSVDDFKLLRVKQLEYKIQQTYLLLGEWEQKRDIAENPNESRRSQIEIQKLRSVYEAYMNELQQVLVPFQA